MYKTFFGLRENPFNVNPDPRFLYLTPQTRAAMDELTYGIQNRKGFILLTGEVGTGKTTLINYLLNWLRTRKTPTAFIFNSHLSANHLFDFILTDFGIPTDYRLNTNMLMRLNTWLIERFRAGERPVLIIDEAQGLSSDLLEEIRLLLNLETASEKLLQIVLAGQPELEQKLRRPELRQLQQRITLRCNTGALSLEECHGYIAERVRIGGASREDIFAAEAMDAVHFYSQGIPRVINLLCEHALINAYVEHSPQVAARMVEDAAREFLLDEYQPVGIRRNSGKMADNTLAVIHTIFAEGLSNEAAAEKVKAPMAAPASPSVNVGSMVAMEATGLKLKDGNDPVVQRYGADMTWVNTGERPATAIPVMAACEARKTESNAASRSGASVNAIAAAMVMENKRSAAKVLPISPSASNEARAEQENAAVRNGRAAEEKPPLTLEAMNQLPGGLPAKKGIAATAPRTHQTASWLKGPMPAKLPLISHTTLFKVMTSLLPLQKVLRNWAVEFKRDWQAMIRTTPLPALKDSFMRWLWQPIGPATLREAKITPLQAGSDVIAQKT